VPPTFGNGKICYIVIPAADPEVSANFYQRAFGWQIRKRADGAIAFDDGVGEVSGAWTTGLTPCPESTLSMHIMVDDMEATLALVSANGGQIHRPVGADAPLITALIRDPFGNVIGLYQHNR